MIYLASESVARKEILTATGLIFTPIPSQLDERRALLEYPNLSPKRTARTLAIKKATIISTEYPDDVIIGADQTLCCSDEVFHKPQSMAKASCQLKALRGKTHVLYTAVCIMKSSVLLWSTTTTSKLTMWNFSDKFIEEYLSVVGEDVLNTVGGYHLEGVGVRLFEKIHGDYFGIRGLPVIPVLNFLREKRLT